jgi:dienelactone hydrolase
MKRSLGLLLVLSLIMALVSVFGCDGGTTGVCTSSTSVTGAGSSELYYPCSGSGALPATTMTSGFLGTDEQVSWLARDVAGNGFVVLAMTPLNPMGMVSGWRDAHRAGIAKLRELNTSGVLRGRIDTNKLQTCGHSKGGGGALWASSTLGSQLKSTIGMAPWQEEFLSLSGIQSATLIQAGALDTLATVMMTANEYALLPTGISKGYFQYTTADHMSWATMGTNHSSISQDVVAWMKYYLKGDTSQRATLNSGLGKTVNTWVDLGPDGGSSSSSSGGCN